MFTAAQFLRLLQAHFAPNLIVIFPYRTPIRPHCLGNGALAGDLRMFPQIGGDCFLLFADPVRDGIQVSALLDGPDLRLYLLNQSGQEDLALLLGLGVHIAGVLLAIRPHRGVPALPAVFADLSDTSGAGLSFPSYTGLECGHRPVLLQKKVVHL